MKKFIIGFLLILWVSVGVAPIISHKIGCFKKFVEESQSEKTIKDIRKDVSIILKGDPLYEKLEYSIPPIYRKNSNFFVSISGVEDFYIQKNPGIPDRFYFAIIKKEE